MARQVFWILIALGTLWAIIAAGVMGLHLMFNPDYPLSNAMLAVWVVVPATFLVATVLLRSQITWPLIGSSIAFALLHLRTLWATCVGFFERCGPSELVALTLNWEYWLELVFAILYLVIAFMAFRRLADDKEPEF